MEREPGLEEEEDEGLQLRNVSSVMLVRGDVFGEVRGEPDAWMAWSLGHSSATVIAAKPAPPEALGETQGEGWGEYTSECQLEEVLLAGLRFSRYIRF